MEQLVSTEWLESNSGAPDLVVLDCTVYLDRGPDGYVSVSGADNFAGGHIPSAVFADLTTDLCDIDSELRFAVPAPETFCEAMGALGVGDESRVVLYDDNGSMWAARVWWMLRWVGFDNAAILDGGLGLWQSEGRQLTTQLHNPSTRQLTASVRPGLIADKAEVLAAIDDQNVCLVDALPEPVYRGEVAAYRRPGHIPTATNVPATGLVDSSGRFLPVDELKAKFSTGAEDRTIAYCGGGIAASADAFVMTMLGYQDVAVYTASLQEWAQDPDVPLVTDA